MEYKEREEDVDDLLRDRLSYSPGGYLNIGIWIKQKIITQTYFTHEPFINQEHNFKFKYYYYYLLLGLFFIIIWPCPRFC